MLVERGGCRVWAPRETLVKTCVWAVGMVLEVLGSRWIRMMTMRNDAKGWTERWPAAQSWSPHQKQVGGRQRTGCRCAAGSSLWGME